jgi:hypothetical protein
MIRTMSVNANKHIFHPLRQQSTSLSLLLILSVLLRVGVAFYLGDYVPPPPNAPDDTSYSLLAERLASGHGYSFDQPWYPFGKPAGYPTACWSFPYTAYLAGIYALFGVHPLAARLVSAVLGGLLLPFMVYRLTRRLFPGQDRLALLAAGCAALYGYFVLYAARLMTETFYIVALLWTLERALALAEQPTLVRGVILGVSLGITTLLRQSVLPFAILLFVWLLWVAWRSGHLQHMVGALAVAGLVLALAILPFTLRNYRVYGDFLLLNSNAGYAMYSAQHPMHGVSFQEHAAAPLPKGLRGLNEPQLDRELMRLGIRFVLADPVRYLRLSLSRVLDYFEFWPTADSTTLYDVGRTASFGLFLPFMLYGLWLAMRRSGPLHTPAAWARFSITPLALILLFMVSYSLLHILTWAMPRYRLPVDAVALSLAALALNELILYIGSLSAK